MTFRKHPEKLKYIQAAALNRGWKIESSDIPWALYGNDQPNLECCLVQESSKTHKCFYYLGLFVVVLLLIRMLGIFME